jgi:phenylalanyl-tRNA synthetase beta chain
MWEYGQPLHAFDFQALRDGKIIVRRAREGESIVSLDDVDRDLSPDMLVIADAKVPVAIAGVMGGLESEVIDTSRAILLESANFKSASIRNTASTLKLVSEASGRFDKGLSPELTVPALKRATQLIADLAGGKPAKGIMDVYPGKTERSAIKISEAQVRRLLGVEWTVDVIEEVLASLGFSCTRISDSELSAVVPWWRTDIFQPADLVEEVARIIGYDQIPLTMLESSLPSQQPNLALQLRERIRDTMVRSGFQEAINYSLVPRERTLEMPSAKVANPISSEQEYLRTSLVPGLLTVLGRNQRHDEGGLRFFEIGKTYRPREKDLPEEHEILVAVASGPRAGETWLSDAREAMGFYDAKGVAQSLLGTLGLEADFEPTSGQMLHPGRASSIRLGGRDVGTVGELHPKLTKDYDLLERPVCIVEMELDSLAGCITEDKKKYSSIPRFPSSARDLALVLDVVVPAKKVEGIIGDFPLVDQVSLFDVYTGKQIPEGKKSLGFRVVFQAPDRTLTEGEISIIERDILTKLNQEIGAVLRG